MMMDKKILKLLTMFPDGKIAIFQNNLKKYLGKIFYTAKHKALLHLYFFGSEVFLFHEYRIAPSQPDSK
jgi:hypothetical protein